MCLKICPQCRIRIIVSLSSKFSIETGHIVWFEEISRNKINSVAFVICGAVGIMGMGEKKSSTGIFWNKLIAALRIVVLIGVVIVTVCCPVALFVALVLVFVALVVLVAVLPCVVFLTRGGKENDVEI